MFTRIIASLMAGALVLTTITVSPAMARDRSDNRNLIAGLAIGAIVGAAIASNSRNRNGGNVSRGYVGDAYPYGRGDDDGRGYVYAPGHGNAYGHGRRVDLPAACRVYNGNRSGYSGRCLDRSYRGHAALPAACAVHVGGHHHTIYRDRCLNQYGYY